MISGYRDPRLLEIRKQVRLISQNYVDDCAPLAEQGCAQIGSKLRGVCGRWIQPSARSMRNVSCQSGGMASLKPLTDCGGQALLRVMARVFDAGYTPDGDFALAITGMEALRQAGNYMDPDTLTLFNGRTANAE